MKKVIVVATYFPPAGGISTFRITKFVKFLSQFNWQPAVVTVNEECYRECDFLIDNSLSKDIADDLVIYRTGIRKEYKVLKALLNGLPTRWLKPLFKIIGSIIKKEKPDLLFATGDPFFPLLIAPFARRFYKLNYVIDLRDPWALAVMNNPIAGFKGRIFQPVNNFLEPIVLNKASKIIVVSEKMAREYREAYPKRNSQDFVVIPNGYDPDDYDLIPATPFNKFTITYAGKFLFGKSFRNPTYFFKALKILESRGVWVIFRYIGAPNEDVEAIAEKIGVNEHIESTGYLSYNETISNMKGSDVLLLIGNGQETEQTGKIFDYLGCKRPVLALAAKKGGIADVVEGIDAITLIENENPEAIADAIEQFYQNRDTQPVNRANIDKFLRSMLTKRLADVFDSVTNNQDL